MYIKTTWDTFTFSINIYRVKFKRLIIPSVGENVKQLELSYTDGEYKMAQLHWKIIGRFF